MREAGELGMTLIEMLVVLAIIGVVSAAALLGVANMSRDGGAEAEARQFGALMRLAADEAMVTDRPIALAFDAKGYAFVDAAEHAGDAPVEDPALGDRHDLRSGVTLTIERQRSPLAITADGTGDPVRALVDDGRTAWQVRFDGVDVVTSVATGG